MNNPFNPSFGKVPPIYLDRTARIEDLISELRNPDSPFQATLVYGQRGSGKTSFMTALCLEIEKEKDFIVLNIPSSGNILLSYVQGIYDKTSKVVRKTLDSLDGISLSVFGVQLEYNKKDDGQINYQLLLEKILKKLSEKKITVLAVIDEVKASRELKEFISVYQILLRQNFPVRLLLAGLPQNVSELQNDNQLTFLLRAPRVTLEPLDSSNVRYNYKKAFESGGKTLDEKALDKMTRASGGYAYAFQLMGWLLWKNTQDKITEKNVDSVLDEYKMLLFRNAYIKIAENLSRMDKAFVINMAKNTGPTSMKELVREMGKSNAYLSNYRARLLDSQIIKQTSYGYVGFALPYFREFVNERLAAEFE
ncbi:MAG: ATP-binding protein [Treponema sp.]|nr:ATP-binding protein [Treponema sp.]